MTDELLQYISSQNRECAREHLCNFLVFFFFSSFFSHSTKLSFYDLGSVVNDQEKDFSKCLGT